LRLTGSREQPGRAIPEHSYLIFVLAIALRQLPDDDIRTAGHVKGAFKKYGVADFEFVDGNDGTSCWTKFNDSNLVAGWILQPRKRAYARVSRADLSRRGNGRFATTLYKS
jgi:hypothetical protein